MTTASLLVVLGCSLGAVRTTFTPLETTLLTKTKLGNSRGRSGSQNYHRMQRLQRAALPYTSLPSGRAGMNFKLQIVHSEENGREMCNVQKRRHFLASIAASSGLTIPKYVRSCEDDAPISKYGIDIYRRHLIILSALSHEHLIFGWKETLCPRHGERNGPLLRSCGDGPTRWIF